MPSPTAATAGSKPRRARVSCEHCQHKKARCSAEISLMPRINCKLDGAECRVFTGKVEKHGRLQAAIEILQHSLQANSEPSPLSSSLRAQLRGFQDMASPPPQSRRLSGSSPISTETLGATLPSQKGHSRNNRAWTLPAFIRSPPPHLDASDYRYLIQQQALVLPSNTLQEALIRAYLDSVHAILPILDMHSFLRSTSLEDAPGVSLFLFQAVMYGGVATVPLELLTEEGFSTGAAARAAYYAKVEALERLYYETDSLDLIQGELVMAYWQGIVRSPGHHACWVQLAVSNVQSLGPCLSPPCTPERRATYVRVYWGCFLLNRVHTLAARRRQYFRRALGPPGVEGLQPSDFHVAPYEKRAQECMGLPPADTDVDAQMRITKLFILRVSLFEQVEPLFFDDDDDDGHACNPISALEPADNQHPTLEVDPVTRRTQSLLSWYDRFSTLTDTPAPSQPAPLAQAFLSITLDACVSLLLYRESRSRDLDSRTAMHPGERGDAERKRLLATSGVTSSFVWLHSCALLAFAPPYLAAVLLAAAVAHSTQMRDASTADLRARHSDSLHQALDVLHALGRDCAGVRNWATGL
ncbi:hypothetical protein BJY00DRAFT_313236 [Aspergillus carlsbadensis]|nr:hypothetical protein BJY00DRAFT_313236 [Aspergillus carlsbadensis]